MNKNKLIVTQVHTDSKFIIFSERFYNPKFINQLIFFGENPGHNGTPLENTFFYFDNTIKSIKSVINKCNQSDIVVLYDLNFIKCYIANRLNPSVKIIWRFFGLELYKKMPEYVYSPLTLSVLKKQHKGYLQNNIYKLLAKSENLLKYRTTFEKEFKKALKRVNYFCGVSDMEYQFLKTKWTGLPQFLQWPLSNIESNTNTPTKNNQIILGNNRSAYNNHLDVLEILSEYKSDDNIQFLLLFNYGQNNEYSNNVIEKARNIKNITILEDFLCREEFSKLYLTSSAFVMNGYRQMALGNIFEALKNNVKIYLNEKNIIYDWLIKEGFKIFLINNLMDDLNNNQFNLTDQEATYNQNNLKTFAAKYSAVNFRNAIFEIVKSKN